MPAPTSTWLVYDASVLPDENDPAFSAINVTNPLDTTSWIIADPDLAGNKMLKFIDSVAVTGKYMWGFNWKMNATQGATIVFRVKLSDLTVYQRTFEVEYRDGSLRERLFVLPGGVIKLDRADTMNVLPSNIDGWHTYRIIYQNGVSTVYLNEDPNPFLTGASTSANSSNDVRFGGGSDDNACRFLLDWFIFDTTGVYAPGQNAIPETLFVYKPTIAYQWQIYDTSVMPPENDPPFLESNVKSA